MVTICVHEICSQGLLVTICSHGMWATICFHEMWVTICFHVSSEIENSLEGCILGLIVPSEGFLAQMASLDGGNLEPESLLTRSFILALHSAELCHY
jgi:hypothetical protein